jgi:hypothetical protein
VYCCDGASWQQTGDAPLREEVRQRWQMFTIVHVCKAVFQVQSKTAVATLETSSLFGRCCTNDALDFQLAAELPTRDFITIPKILNPVTKGKTKGGGNKTWQFVFHSLAMSNAFVFWMPCANIATLKFSEKPTEQTLISIGFSSKAGQH